MDCASEKSLNVERSEETCSNQCGLTKEEPWDTYLMHDLSGRMTGLPMVIYVTLRQGEHAPRLKVSKHYGYKYFEGENFVLTLEDEPQMIGDSGNIQREDVKLVKTFIKLNRSKLLAFWNDEIDMYLTKFRRVSSEANFTCYSALGTRICSILVMYSGKSQPSMKL